MAAGLVGAAVPTVCFITGIRLLGAPRAAILATLEPVVGVALSAWLLNEQPSPLQLFGGALDPRGSAAAPGPRARRGGARGRRRVTLQVTWSQALAWRMRAPAARPDRAGPGRWRRSPARRRPGPGRIVRRARHPRSARGSRRGEVARALADGRLVKTWAMRGTLHLLTPEEGGAFLSLMAAGRSWERPSWQSTSA